MCHKFKISKSMGFGNSQFVEGLTKGINRRQKIVLNDISEDNEERYQWY